MGGMIGLHSSMRRGRDSVTHRDDPREHGQTVLEACASKRCHSGIPLRGSQPKLGGSPPRGPGSDIRLTAYDGQENREIRVEAVERRWHAGDLVLAVRELGQAEETKVVAPEPSLCAFSASRNGR
jgi:hypothetical protein